MKFALILIGTLGAMRAGDCIAAPEAGKAKVQLQAVSSTYQAGRPLQAAISMRLEDGWHTYWENPGDAGMPMKVLWELPAGWRADELEFPSPSSFAAGGLTSYGYKGAVVFPVLLHPPAGANGPVELKAKVSWLVCNEDACLPGSAHIMLDLTSGPSTPGDSAEMIAENLTKIPRDNVKDIILTVSEGPEELRLALKVKEAVGFQPRDYEVFPATPQVIDGTAKYEWVFSAGQQLWQTTLPKSDHAADPVKELALVFVGKSGQAPMRVNWKIK